MTESTQNYWDIQEDIKSLLKNMQEAADDKSEHSHADIIMDGPLTDEQKKANLEEYLRRLSAYGI